jgi:hypothetical protein
MTETWTDLKGTQQIIESARPRIERIQNIILAVEKAFENKNTRLDKVIVELKNLQISLKSKDVEEKSVIEEVDKAFSELSRSNSKEADKIRRACEGIIRDEKEKEFLKSVLGKIDEERIDEALEELLKNFDGYIKKLETEYKDKRTAAMMKKERDKPAIRVEKRYLEEKNKTIDSWNERSDIPNCIKTLQEIISRLQNIHKDIKLSQRLLKSDEIRKLLRFEDEKKYLGLLINKIESEERSGNSRWEFFRKKFYQEGIAKKKITNAIFRKHFADGYTANVLESRIKVGEDIKTWLDILRAAAKELETGQPKKSIVINARQELKKIFGDAIPKLSEESAKAIEEIKKTLDERIKKIGKKKVPGEIEKIVKELQEELNRTIREFYTLSGRIQDKIAESIELEVNTKADSELEKLRKSSEELKHATGNQEKGFTYILTVLSYMKKKGDIPLNYVAAMQSVLTSISSTNKRIESEAEEHNEAVDFMDESDKEKIKLYGEIIAEFSTAAPAIETIVKKAGVEGIGEIKALPEIR